MKSILRLTTAIIFLCNLSIQPLSAASHKEVIHTQANSAPVYSVKQAKKIKKLERKLEKRQAKKEEKPVKWGNKAFKMLGLAMLSVVIGIFALLAGPAGMIFYVLGIGLSGWGMIRGIKGMIKSEKGSTQQLVSVLAALLGFFTFIGLIGMMPLVIFTM